MQKWFPALITAVMLTPLFAGCAAAPSEPRFLRPGPDAWAEYEIEGTGTSIRMIVQSIGGVSDHNGNLRPSFPILFQIRWDSGSNWTDVLVEHVDAKTGSIIRQDILCIYYVDREGSRHCGADAREINFRAFGLPAGLGIGPFWGRSAATPHPIATREADMAPERDLQRGNDCYRIRTTGISDPGHGWFPALVHQNGEIHLCDGDRFPTQVTLTQPFDKWFGVSAPAVLHRIDQEVGAPPSVEIASVRACEPPGTNTINIHPEQPLIVDHPWSPFNLRDAFDAAMEDSESLQAVSKESDFAVFDARYATTQPYDFPAMRTLEDERWVITYRSATTPAQAVWVDRTTEQNHLSGMSSSEIKVSEHEAANEAQQADVNPSLRGQNATAVASARAHAIFSGLYSDGYALTGIYHRFHQPNKQPGFGEYVDHVAEIKLFGIPADSEDGVIRPVRVTTETRTGGLVSLNLEAIQLAVFDEASLCPA